MGHASKKRYAAPFIYKRTPTWPQVNQRVGLRRSGKPALHWAFVDSEEMVVSHETCLFTAKNPICLEVHIAQLPRSLDAQEICAERVRTQELVRV